MGPMWGLAVAWRGRWRGRGEDGVGPEGEQLAGSHTVPPSSQSPLRAGWWARRQREKRLRGHVACRGRVGLGVTPHAVPGTSWLCG